MSIIKMIFEIDHSGQKLGAERGVTWNPSINQIVKGGRDREIEWERKKQNVCFRDRRGWEANK